LPVLVRINGKPRTAWRINMMPTGDGGFYLYLHGDIRKTSATKVGDRVAVEVRFDATYRNGPMHSMPSWFRSALARAPAGQKSMGFAHPEPQEGDSSLFRAFEIR